LQVQYKLYCRNAADAIAPCNGLEDHAHVRPTYSGSLTGAAASMDGVQRTAAWIVRDFNMPTPRIGGEGTNAFASHLATGDYQIMISDSLNHLKFAPTPAMPVSGQIDLTVNVSRNRPDASPADRTFSTAIVVLFTGADTATVTLDAMQSYTLTLSTGAVVRN
jgi:hypothetical protein